MTEVVLPPWIIPEVETQEPLDEGSTPFRAAFAPGLTQRQSFGGLRLKLSRKHTVRGEEKAQLLSILRATKGSYNTLWTKVHFALRGSGLGSELLTNNTFASGTTGWTADQATLTVADRILRVTASGAGAQPGFRRASVSVTQYMPYVMRVAFGAFNFTAPDLRSYINNGVGETNASVTASGLATASVVSQSSTLSNVGGYYAPTTGHLAGSYFDAAYASLTQCAHIDIGSNLLQQSEALGTSPWTTTNATVTANAIAAPDGNSTADAIVENTTSGGHGVIQSSITVSTAMGDYVIGAAVKAGTRTWAFVQFDDNTDSVSAYINLSTGALGTVAASGAFANARAFSVSMGNGWYIVYVGGKKPAGSTSMRALVRAATGDGGQSYAGVNGNVAIYAWRVTFVQSSVPTRLVQTTSAASTGTSPTGGAMYLKGLTASTSGLLLPEDIVGINGELKHVTAALNSDAAGLGYLQFEPALVRSPVDNDPVIGTDPLGKFLISNIKIENEFGTQAVVTYDLEHIYE